jgi:hypothetical protein
LFVTLKKLAQRSSSVLGTPNAKATLNGMRPEERIFLFSDEEIVDKASELHMQKGNCMNALAIGK